MIQTEASTGIGRGTQWLCIPLVQLTADRQHRQRKNPAPELYFASGKMNWGSSMTAERNCFLRKRKHLFKKQLQLQALKDLDFFLHLHFSLPRKKVHRRWKIRQIRCAPLSIFCLKIFSKQSPLSCHSSSYQGQGKVHVMWREHCLSPELKAGHTKAPTTLQTHWLPGASTMHIYNSYAPCNLLLGKIKSTFGAVIWISASDKQGLLLFLI